MQRKTMNIGPWAMAFDYLADGNPAFIRRVGLAALDAAMLVTFDLA